MISITYHTYNCWNCTAKLDKLIRKYIWNQSNVLMTTICLQPHKTILEKHGKPDDVMIGVKKHKEPLPPVPLTGMYNKTGGKVRLTFKLEHDQLWIGTKGG
jgi:hypothetical protein